MFRLLSRLHVASVSDSGVDSNTLVNMATQLAVNLLNSRQIEFKADTKGQKYLDRKGELGRGSGVRERERK